MEPTPTPQAPAPRRDDRIDADPDRGTSHADQTDQDVDTAGTEADESAVGSALDKSLERHERGRSASGRSGGSR